LLELQTQVVVVVELHIKVLLLQVLTAVLV